VVDVSAWWALVPLASFIGIFVAFDQRRVKTAQVLILTFALSFLVVMIGVSFEAHRSCTEKGGVLTNGVCIDRHVMLP
jgi:hypothetical protein